MALLDLAGSILKEGASITHSERSDRSGRLDRSGRSDRSERSDRSGRSDLFVK